MIGTSHGYLYVVKPAQSEMVLKAGTGIFADRVGFRLKRGTGLSDSVWDRGQTLSLDDYADWPSRVAEIGDGVRAVVGIPLRVRSKVAGLFGLAAPTCRSAAGRLVDAGPGVKREDQPRLFEHFYRVKNQGNIPETGLGLVIARELVQLHAGHIAVTSTPDAGSIFAFYLPLHKGDEE